MPNIDCPLPNKFFHLPPKTILPSKIYMQQAYVSQFAIFFCPPPPIPADQGEEEQ